MRSTLAAAVEGFARAAEPSSAIGLETGFARAAKPIEVEEGLGRAVEPWDSGGLARAAVPSGSPWWRRGASFGGGGLEGEVTKFCSSFGHGCGFARAAEPVRDRILPNDWSVVALALMLDGYLWMCLLADDRRSSRTRSSLKPRCWTGRRSLFGRWLWAICLFLAISFGHAAPKEKEKKKAGCRRWR
jgi:hypothetical protein